MNALYLSDHEKAALRAVDLRELERLVDEALWQQRTTGLYALQLANCGAYVANQLRAFDRTLADYAKSKSAKKREDLRGRAWMAGRDLGSAVRAMLERADEEDKERQLFRVSDMINTPYRFSEHLEIRVHFDWRARGRRVEFRDDHLRPRCRYTSRLYAAPASAQAEAERCQDGAGTPGQALPALGALPYARDKRCARISPEGRRRRDDSGALRGEDLGA